MAINEKEFKELQTTVTDLRVGLEGVKGTLKTHAIVAVVLAGVFGIGGGVLGFKVVGLAAALDAEKAAVIAEIKSRSNEERKDLMDLGKTERGTIEATADKRLAELRDTQAPIGSVVAWTSEADFPKDWRLCDGTPISAKDYPVLAKVLNTTYGAAGPDVVVLPDFQGYFLRGFDPKGNVDPEGPKRKLGKPPQEDSFKSHQHQMVTIPSGFAGGPASAEMFRTDDSWKNEKSQPRPTELDGGKETRPKNYAVHWIIRVGFASAVDAQAKPASGAPVNGVKK